MNNSFGKSDRLNSKVVIDNLFEAGKSCYAYPFRIIYEEMPAESASAVQVLFSVPKRIFKRAVMRNKIRRRSKEAYRLRKTCMETMLGAKDKKIAVMFIYTAKEELDYHVIEKGIEKGLQKLKSVI